jgi:hypothetical protein
LDDDTRRDLMRKKICFTCKDTWVPDHRCMGKGDIHYIEVATDSHEEEHDNVSTSSEEEPSHAEEQPPRKLSTPVGAQPPVETQPCEKANRWEPTNGESQRPFLVFPSMIPSRSEGLFRDNEKLS